MCRWIVEGCYVLDGLDHQNFDSYVYSFLPGPYSFLIKLRAKGCEMILDSRETLDVVDSATKAHHTVQEFRKETVYCENKPTKHWAANVMLCNNVQWLCNMSVFISWILHTKLWSILQVKSYYVEHQEFGLELGVV